MSFIDLNADLGEGIGNDAVLMQYLTSCSIACGVHAGDSEIIKEVIRLADQFNVKVGAHPSFPDRLNFGREEMELPEKELKSILRDQIQLIKDRSEREGLVLHHVKPHGALYNMATSREDIARAIVSVMLEFPAVSLYAPYGSVISEVARRNGIRILYEIFADRNYNDDLTLVSRKDKNAVLHEPEAIAKHVIRMIKDREVKTINGKYVPIEADTICIHGDNPQAIAIVKTLRSKLEEAGIEIS